MISRELLSYHYKEHHGSCVDNLNMYLEVAEIALAAGDFKKYVDCSQLIKYTGGGHFNHEFFWESLSPIGEVGGIEPSDG